MPRSRKEYMAQYYLDHQDHYKALKREWRLANRDHDNARRRCFYHLNKEAIKVARTLGVHLAEARRIIAEAAARRRSSQERAYQCSEKSQHSPAASESQSPSKPAPSFSPQSTALVDPQK